MKNASAILLSVVLLFGFTAAEDKTKKDCPRKQEYVDSIGCVTPPKVLKKSRLEFPREARKAGIAQGMVFIQLVIHKDGKTSAFKIKRVDPAGHGFEEAALEAVKAWKFRPAATDAGPIDAPFSVVVSFTR